MKEGRSLAALAPRTSSRAPGPSNLIPERQRRRRARQRCMGRKSGADATAAERRDTLPTPQRHQLCGQGRCPLPAADDVTLRMLLAPRVAHNSRLTICTLGAYGASQDEGGEGQGEEKGARGGRGNCRCGVQYRLDASLTRLTDELAAIESRPPRGICPRCVVGRIRSKG